MIPLTLVYHKDLKHNRQNKVLMMSYGAYGIA
jgi:protease II